MFNNRSSQRHEYKARAQARTGSTKMNVEYEQCMNVQHSNATQRRSGKQEDKHIFFCPHKSDSDRRNAEAEGKVNVKGRNA